MGKWGGGGGGIKNHIKEDLSVLTFFFSVIFASFHLPSIMDLYRLGGSVKLVYTSECPL